MRLNSKTSLLILASLLTGGTMFGQGGWGRGRGRGAGMGRGYGRNAGYQNYTPQNSKATAIFMSVRASVGGRMLQQPDDVLKQAIIAAFSQQGITISDADAASIVLGFRSHAATAAKQGNMLRAIDEYLVSHNL